MRATLLVSALLLCGCASSHYSTESHAIAQDKILDEVLARPDYATAIKQAECDRPDDEWRDKPWRSNFSRFRREIGVSQEMLAEIRPRVTQMTVTELVRSLKTIPRPALTSFPGVSYYVFRDGNEMIIAEIQSRPKSELVVLPSLADENMEVWEGDQGPGDSLAEIIHYRILHDK